MTALLTYVPRDTVLHRFPAGPKVALLAAVSLASVLNRSVWPIAILLVVVAIGFVVARIPLRQLRAQLRLMLPLFLVLGIYQWVANGGPTALRVVGGLFGVVMLASLVSLTTPASALIDLAVRLARPLRHVGADPERLGLMAALGIRSVTVMHGLAVEVREAQVARGLGLSPRAFAAPLVVRALRQADDLAEALAARGVGD